MRGVVEAQAGKVVALGPIGQDGRLRACHLRVKTTEPHDAGEAVVACVFEVGDAARLSAGADLQKRDGFVHSRHRYALTTLTARMPERSQTLRVSITSLAFATRTG